jgi:selenium metabolism protein YedF
MERLRSATRFESSHSVRGIGLKKESTAVKRAVIINSETIGKGDDELGKRLMRSFLRKLCMSHVKPDTIIFYNAGVKLMVEGSFALDSLDLLFKAGVDLMACGTCVGYYGIADSIAVGRVGNMQEVVSIVMNAESVVTM